MKRFLLIVFVLFAISPVGVYAQRQKKSTLGTAMHKKEIVQLVDSIENALRRWYILQDKVGVMLSPVKKNLKQGVYATFPNRHELASKLLMDMLEDHKDGHLGILYFPELAEFLECPVPDSVSRQQRERGLVNARENNFGFKKTEILQGNIGYVRLDGFYPFVEEAKTTADAAFRLVSHCRALIIDLRYNGGGSPDMVLLAQSYFVSEKTHMNDIIDSKNDTLRRWADPAVTSFQLNMPVYILIGRNTFSGAEDFAYGLQQIKRATIVGDTSGGGAHPSGDFSLGQGFVIRIPTHRSCNPISRTDWEGTGVRPDLAVPADEAFTQAQVAIFTDLLAEANDEEKREYQWSLTCIENKAMLAYALKKEPIQIGSEILKSYCGRYHVSNPDERIMPFSIVVKEGRLGRHFDDGYEDMLVPVSFTKFVIDDDSGRTIEFVKSGELPELIFSKQSGTYKMIKN